jgi:hypothetical protein
MSASTMGDIEKHVEKLGYALEGKITKADYLEINFHELNFSNPLGRWAVIVCFAFGFGVLTFLSGKVFCRVITLLYQNPFGV